MKANIIEGCISCGMCASTCPEVFHMADSGVAEVYAAVDAATEETAKAAAEGCPVNVIQLVD